MWKLACQPGFRALTRPSLGSQCAPTSPRRRGDIRAFARAAELEPATQPRDDMKWDNLGFDVANVAPTMFIASTNGSGWSEGQLKPYGPISMDPAAQVLNYGQSIFEGMKAQRTESGQIVLFRPKDNAARMRDGARRMSMMAPDEDLFLQGVVGAVRENADMVPPFGKGSMYLRPLLLGTGPILGLGTAPAFTFTVYGTPVGSYFKNTVSLVFGSPIPQAAREQNAVVRPEAVDQLHRNELASELFASADLFMQSGQMQPIELLVETSFHRAAPGGMGATKCAGNYSPVLFVQLQAKEQGYADVVYLDAQSNTYLEEVSSCNIFIVHGNTVKTPPLKGTILPGITRRSVITLLEDMGYNVIEEPVSITEAMQADEVFTTGTAVVVSSVGSITYQGERKEYCSGEVGPVTDEVYKQLTGIQTQQIDDPYGWIYPVLE